MTTSVEWPIQASAICTTQGPGLTLILRFFSRFKLNNAFELLEVMKKDFLEVKFLETENYLGYATPRGCGVALLAVV